MQVEAQTSSPDSLKLTQCKAIFQRVLVHMSPPVDNEAVVRGADSLLEAAQSVGSIMYIGRALYAKGTGQGALKEREAAVRNMQDAVRCLEISRDSSYLGQSYYSLAALQYITEDLESAQRNAQTAMALGQQSKDSIVHSLSLNLFALVQKNLGNHEVAIQYLEEGFQSTIPHMRHILLQNLGTIYKEVEEYDKAKKCFEEVVSFHEKSGLNTPLATGLSNLASVELRLGEPEKALIHLERALSLSDDRAHPRVRGLIKMNLGVTHQRLGSCSKALPFYVAARETLEELGEQKQLVQALENEAECRMKIGQPGQAYRLLERAKLIGDSLFSLERTEAIAELEQNYRQAEQRQRIQDLEKENTLVLERNAATTKSLRNQRITLALLGVVILLLVLLGYALFRVQKNRLLRLNEADKQQLLRQQIKPHFIFNALNSVQHFLLHDQKKEGLLYLGKLGALLRLILNNSEPDLVSISEELKLIRHYLEMEQIRTNHKFDFEIQVEEGLDMERLQVPGMVLQVLVENAIWHGAGKSEDMGKIVVAVARVGKKVEIRVEDNGPGLAVEAVSSKPGHVSRGLGLVRKRIRRAQWEDVRFDFELKSLFEKPGQALGTRASIFLVGNSLSE